MTAVKSVQHTTYSPDCAQDLRQTVLPQAGDKRIPGRSDAENLLVAERHPKEAFLAHEAPWGETGSESTSHARGLREAEGEKPLDARAGRRLLAITKQTLNQARPQMALCRRPSRRCPP